MPWWGSGKITERIALLARAPTTDYFDRAEAAKRAEAATALGQSNDPRARVALMTALDDRSTAVVTAAATSLQKGRFDLDPNDQALVAVKLGDFETAGKIYSQMAPARRNLKPISDIFTHPKNRNEINIATSVLIAIGDEDCLEMLCEGLDSKSHEVRQECASALNRLNKKAIPALQRALQHTDREIRDAAAYGLARLGDPNGIRCLTEDVRRGDPTDDVVRKLRTLLEMAVPDIAPLLLNVIKTQRGGARMVALEALEKMGGDDVVKGLTELLESDPERSLSDKQPGEFIELTLARLGSPNAVGPLVAVLQRTNEQDRKEYQVIEEYCPSIQLGTTSRELLRQLVERHAHDVSTAALEACVRLEDLVYYDTQDTDDGRWRTTGTHTVVFSHVRRIARRELDMRRSLLTLTPTAPVPASANDSMLNEPFSGPKERQSISNDDVLALTKAGLSAAAIVIKIQKSTCVFMTEPKDLIDLKQAGVDDGVIEAMLRSEGH